MLLISFFTICLVQIISQASAAKGKYTVIAPGTIHSHEKYTAAVAVHHISKACLIKVGITGPSYNETKNVQVSSKEVKNIEFDLPELEEGYYNLTAEGINCLDNFKNSTRLKYKKFENHIRIQTDKGLYKPGDEINFRVLFLDKDLKPAEPENNAFIWFQDGKRNRIKEIRDLKTVKGVYTGKFKISEYPAMGDWYLGVDNGAFYDNAVHFEVSKYVLPKFLVNVEATEAVSVKDGDMQVIVRANYIYGKPLDGKATVMITLGSEYFTRNETEKQPPMLIKTADMIKGRATIDFNVKNYEAYMKDTFLKGYLSIIGTVEEQLTGVKINGTTRSTIYPHRYFMHCVNDGNCDNFEADQQRDVLLQITYIDGSQLTDTKSTIELIYKEVYQNTLLLKKHAKMDRPPVFTDNTFYFRSHMNETGFVNFKVSLPDLPEYKSYNHFYDMEMKLLDEKHYITQTYQYRAPEKDDLAEKEEYEVKQEDLMLSDEYSLKNGWLLNKANQLTLKSSKPLTYFDYNVIGRGNILKSGRIHLLNKSKVYNLTLTSEYSWMPSFAVYVNYVDKSGEYHYAEQEYEIDFELQNPIDVTVAENVKPGSEVALKIKTAPNSFVGLMAVDQSILLLRDNNDLKATEFRRVLESFRTSTLHQGGCSQYPGTTSGCVTLTNADYFYNRTLPRRERFLKRGRGDRKEILHIENSEEEEENGNEIQVRKDFSETWLFADIENTEAAEFIWTKKIPETITSWVLTAFSMNYDKGLGVTREPNKVTTFKHFFISIRLPYTVKRGEVINVPALVFNYLEKSLNVEITLDNSDNEYEHCDFSNKVIQTPKRTKIVRVPANGAAGVSFLLRPKVIGNVMLKFTATSAVAGDAIHKSMKVVPDGLTQYANRAYLINLNEKREFESHFELDLPKDIVPDSEHIEVGVMGDILGPVLNNLNSLIRLPRGCGEQTMSSLMPNYLVLKYLTNLKRLTPNLDIILRYNLDIGYQNILNYRHSDGSFSSFGPTKKKGKPNNGSTWLTAFIVRSLQQIKEFIDVNDKIIEEGLEFLSEQQVENGSFIENGDFAYASQRNQIALTGAIILAILENSLYAEKYSQQLNKGLDFISQNIDQSNSLHAQAVGAFTLNKAKHAKAKASLSKLKSLAKTESDRKWWSEEKRQFGNRWWYYVFSNDVEITSYALLTLLDQPSTTVDDVLPIIKWLIAQRNSYGGFASTQDTVVGLSALVKFAKFANYEPAKMSVDIESKNKKETIKLTEDNGILYQSIEMPHKTKSIDFTAKGIGSALVQIAYQYNIFEKDPKPSFTIKTTKTDNKERHSHLEMLVCVNYVGDGESSNMALLEITTPSGYVIDDESLTGIKTLERVNHIEVKNSDSLLVVYFDHLYKNDETCLVVEALRTHSVTMQKPASIVLYDYYDTRKKATAFYEIESNLCDICETEEECSKCKK